MDTTVSLLETQINQRLQGVEHVEAIQINQRLGTLLDQYVLPQTAKLACLTIDTSMRHLDCINFDVSSKNTILIGDLLSAHFYTLLAKLADDTFQLNMSKAIIEMNELKSAIHHNRLTDAALVEAIIAIEMTFPYITIKHYAPDSNFDKLNDALIEHLNIAPPTYLQHYSESHIQTLIQDVEQHLKVK